MSGPQDEDADDDLNLAGLFDQKDRLEFLFF